MRVGAEPNGRLMRLCDVDPTSEATDADEVIAQCVEPTEESDEAGDGGAEPELIGRKPSDEDGKEE